MDHDEAFTAGALACSRRAPGVLRPDGPQGHRVDPPRLRRGARIRASTTTFAPRRARRCRGSPPDSPRLRAGRELQGLAVARGVLTYENPLLRARSSSPANGRGSRPYRIGLRVLDWLIVVQTSNAGQSLGDRQRDSGRVASREGHVDQGPSRPPRMMLAAEVALARDRRAALLSRSSARASAGSRCDDAAPAIANRRRGAMLRRPRPDRRQHQQGLGSTLMSLTASSTSAGSARLELIVRSHVDRRPGYPTHGSHDAGDLHVSSGRQELASRRGQEQVDVDAAALRRREATRS